MAKAGVQGLQSNLGREANQPFPIDTWKPKHPSLERYLKVGKGQLTFWKRDGTMLSL